MFLSSCIFCSLTPRIKFFSCKEVLGHAHARNPSDSGEVCRRRRGRCGGKGLGLVCAPWGGRGWVVEGRRKRLHGGAEVAEGFVQVRRAPASSGRRGWA